MGHFVIKKNAQMIVVEMEIASRDNAIAMEFGKD